PGDPTGAMMTIVGSTDPQPLTLDVPAQTQAHHTGSATSAHLKELTFMITQPAGGTFYFATSVDIFLVPTNPMSLLPMVRIATLSPIPNVNMIKLEPIKDIDILPYSDEGANIKAQAIGYYPTEDTTWVGHVVVEVNI